MACNLTSRERLLNVYKSAVTQLAQVRGIEATDFMEALLLLPVEVGDALRESYKKQVEEIDGQEAN